MSKIKSMFRDDGALATCCCIPNWMAAVTGCATCGVTCGALLGPFAEGVIGLFGEITGITTTLTDCAIECGLRCFGK